ncbi:hypothetical protein [Pedobacter metabolipauper]|uniref:DUF4252 domain-containing protein n=1 Tax=Pedobacter metabolipauper TaxID=425513 RepID=A0A4R6SWJ4_9SPHI|nr:hypothetical protein [Pedobacter metabolipauper]TDQ09769.1 hypothetical protein ATK78_1928 [Pedobacter metabolipauper]
MVKNLLVTLFILSVGLTAQSQYTAKIKKAADVVAKATIEGDYTTAINCMYPPAVKMGGGKQAMIALLKKTMEDLEKDGQGFKSASNGEPGEVYRSGKELHSVVPQYMEMKYKDGYLSFTTSMLAVSQDEGKTWTFVSAGNIEPERLKKMFPALNKNLVIIKSTPPVYHSGQ